MSNLKEDILEEYAKHRSPFKTARKLGIENIEIVLEVVREHEGLPSPVDTSNCKFNGQGRPEMQKFLVGRCLAIESWNNKEEEIAEARAKFEKGTHELTTGRDGPWLLLYCIPRAVVTPRPNYFTPTLEA